MIGRAFNRVVGLACLPALPLLALAALWMARGSRHMARIGYCGHLRMMARAAASYVRHGEL